MKSLLDKNTWITKDGRRLKIKNMSNGHLLNTVAMLIRIAPRAHRYTLCEAENMLSMVSGEMAELALDQEVDQIADMDEEEFLRYSVPCYETMVNEIDRRGLRV